MYPKGNSRRLGKGLGPGSQRGFPTLLVLGWLLSPTEGGPVVTLVYHWDAGGSLPFLHRRQSREGWGSGGGGPGALRSLSADFGAYRPSRLTGRDRPPDCGVPVVQVDWSVRALPLLSHFRRCVTTVGLPRVLTVMGSRSDTVSPLIGS